MERLASVSWPGRYVMVTLTYPGAFETEPSEWKRHLAAFRRRWEREYGKTAAGWVMEFQRRGAAHFHLAVRIADDAELAQLQAFASTAWYEVVGSGDLRHLAAGTQVKLVTDIGGVGRYLVNEIGKQRQKQLPDYASRTGAGRWWGVWRMPREEVEVVVTPQEFVRVRRIVRALGRRKGYEFRPRQGSQGVMVFDDSRLPWTVATALASWLAQGRRGLRGREF